MLHENVRHLLRRTIMQLLIIIEIIFIFDLSFAKDLGTPVKKDEINGAVQTENGPAPESVSSTNAMNLDQSPEKIWPKIIKFLALKSITPTVMEKDSGIIIATGRSDPGGIINCKGSKGRLVNYQYKLSISLDKLSTGTRITVMLSGEADSLRRRHLLFIPTSTVKNAVSCTSAGILEKELFSFLSMK